MGGDCWDFNATKEGEVILSCLAASVINEESVLSDL